MAEDFLTPEPTDMSLHHGEQSKPKSVRTAQTLMWVQVALSVLGCLLLVFLINDELEHGRKDDVRLVVALGTLTLVQAIVIGACAALLAPGHPGVRVTILVVEWLLVAISAISMLIGLADGSFQFSEIASFALPLLVAVQLSNQQARQWCGNEPTGGR